MKSFFIKSNIKPLQFKFKYKLHTNDELLELYKCDYLIYNYYLIKYGYFIEDYLKNENVRIIETLITFGYGIEKFLNHPNSRIKITLISYGYDLDKFVNDPSEVISDYAKLMIKERKTYKSPEISGGL
jgi:hypothetical protein